MISRSICRALTSVTATAAMLSASSAVLGAQGTDLEALRAKFRLPVPEVGLATEQGRFPRGAPGTSSGSPIAFGANWNDAFIGFGLQAPVRYSAAGDSDGSASFGFGLGNGQDIAGLEVTINALSTVRSGVGNRVGFGFKAHKIIANGWGIALGVQGVQLQPNSDDRNTVYGVATRSWDLKDNLFEQLTWSGGIGTESFQMAKDLNGGKHGVGVFSSLALRVNGRSSIIADWSGQDLNLGLSFVPFPSLPLVLSPAISDVTGASNSGFVPGVGQKKTGPRFTLGVGFAFRLNPGTRAAAAPAPAETAEDLAIERAAMAGLAAAEPQRRVADDRERLAAERAAELRRAEEANARAAAELRAADSVAAVRRAATAALEAEARAKAAAAMAAVRNALTAPVSASATITAEQRAMYDAKVDILKANPAVRIKIAGHTDERGADATNMKLGLARANAAKRYLVSKGIAATRIETMSYGETRPIETGKTAAAYAKNRRVEFEVLAGGDNLVAPAPAPAPAPKPAVKKPVVRKPATAPAAKAPAKAPATKAPAKAPTTTKKP